jgi:hypothetical protein
MKIFATSGEKTHDKKVFNEIPARVSKKIRKACLLTVRIAWGGGGGAFLVIDDSSVSIPLDLPIRLNMELDFQGLFGLHVHSCTHWLRPRKPFPPSPRIRAHIRGCYWSAKKDDISS